MTDTRGLKVRVKTARKRRPSSTRWLERQLNDPYVRDAKQKGFRSRAAFKLLEIDNRFKILQPGMTVIDLGAAPGGWSQIAAERVQSADGGGKVIGIDLQPVEPIAHVEILVLDFLDPAAPDALKAMLGGGKADIVLSDMAAASTGHKATDHLKIMALLDAAVEFAAEVLAPGGVFLGKVLQGGAEASLLFRMKRQFAQVRHVKPPASRSGSAELYVLATGFRGTG